MRRKQKRNRIIAGILSMALIGAMLFTLVASYFI